MGTKVKGFYKGFKYTLTHMFVLKEQEIEIGNPTDVKHVAHIGWDGPSGSAAPTWMNEFKAGPDFASTSIGKSGSTLSPWISQDNGGTTRQRSLREDSPDGDVHIAKKKRNVRNQNGIHPLKEDLHLP